MSIEEEMMNRLKNAMRTKNTNELDVLRMVKTLAQTEKSAPGFQGNTDDAFWLNVIQRYVKQQSKALEEYKAAGEQGRANAEKIEFEVAYLKPFLPSVLGEAETRTLVQGIIQGMGTVAPSMAGKIMGAIMKDHKEKVDAGLVKKIVTEELAK